MAVRRYRVLDASGRPEEILEVEHLAGSPDLVRHPLDGRPLERLPEAPAIVGRWTERAMGRAAKDATRLKAGGFRRMEKDGDTWRDVT